MISLLEACDRAQRGPRLPVESFDLDGVYATPKGLIDKYDIRCDPATPVPSDDALADKIFDAAAAGMPVRPPRT